MTDISYIFGPYYEGGGAFKVALSTGSSFSNLGYFGGDWFDWISGTLGVPFGPGEILTGDFNGDGKIDFAWWNFNIMGWDVALSTGQRFGSSPPFASIWIENFGGPNIMLIGDFNGDGKTDIVAWNSASGAWHVALSTGHSFDPSGGFWISGFGGPGIMLTGDFNGDGKTDIAGYNADANAWHVALSTGHSFDPSAGFWITNFGAPGAMLTGDFNGDGKTDVAAYTFGSAERPILTTNYNNPTIQTGSAADACQNRTIKTGASFEWTQLFNPTWQFDVDIVGLSGIAVMSELSNGDIPFTHPFGFDWEFYIAPDQRYTSYAGSTNAGPDLEYSNATRCANSLGIWTPRGVIGVETDQDLVPVGYRARQGDRVAVFGRWIADCGHDDFHTEIHPPLVLVTAREGAGAVDPNIGLPPTEATSSFIISRPWLVGQTFDADNLPLIPHLVNEVYKAETDRSFRVEAHPQIYKPYSNLYLINYTLRPPTQRRSPNDRLIVNFHFTVRHGITVQVRKADSDSVGVVITMNPANYHVPPLPEKQDWDIPADWLDQYSGGLLSKIQIVTYAAAATGLDPYALLASVALNRDWLADRYQAPVASSVHDSEITRIAVNDLSGNTPFSVDDSQPFPIYGQMLLQWERH
jgi:hypothetical protein